MLKLCDTRFLGERAATKLSISVNLTNLFKHQFYQYILCIQLRHDAVNRNIYGAFDWEIRISDFRTK